MDRSIVYSGADGRAYLYGQGIIFPEETTLSLDEDNFVLAMTWRSGPTMTIADRATVLNMPSVQRLREHLATGIAADPLFFHNSALSADFFREFMMPTIEDIVHYYHANR